MTEAKNSFYLTEVVGNFGVVARLVASSISKGGVRLDTFELEYPRQIHAEVRTHCMIDMNSSSTRAIPMKFMRQIVLDNPARPIVLTKNQAGMQGKEVHDGKIPLSLIADVYHHTIEAVVKYFKDCGVNLEGRDWVGFDEFQTQWSLRSVSADHEIMERAGFHKQITNRYIEPYQFMKVVMTGTEFANFFNLRFQEDADPTIIELANCMIEAQNRVTPELLGEGEWHTPYVSHARGVQDDAPLEYFVGEVGTPDFQWLTAEEAIKVSCCACAQVSYRKLDVSAEKIQRVYALLINGGIIHGSAFSHVGTPIRDSDMDMFKGTALSVNFLPETWQDGVTHVDRSGQLWSSKLRGWVQYRKLIPNENCTEFNFKERRKEVYGTEVGKQLTNFDTVPDTKGGN